MAAWRELSDWGIAQWINFVVFDCGEMGVVESDVMVWTRPYRHRRRVAGCRTPRSIAGWSSQLLDRR
jgi:hypothetical protein